MVRVSAVAPQSPSTRQQPRRLPCSPRSSPRSRPARSLRRTLPVGVLSVVKTVCRKLSVGPVRHRRQTSSTRPDHNEDLAPLPSTLESSLSQMSRSSSMEVLLQCANCAESFDLERRRPKVLPCGHTHCQACVLASLRDNRVICPTDQLVVHVDALHLQDDLQLICWLEATAQGLVECVCCAEPFDGLLRRPAALDCGHSVCRVCLQASGVRGPRLLAAPLARADSIDETWEYSQDDDEAGDTCSSVCSLSSDEGVAVRPVRARELLVDCPIAWCLKGVRARDNLHLLGCLDDSAASRSQAKVKRAIRCEDQLLEKLAVLEKQIASVYGGDASAKALKGLDTDSSAAGHHFNDADMSALLASVRQLVERKDSPRSEPAVFNQVVTGNCALPDLVMNKAALLRRKEESCDIFSLKDCKIELDVYDMSLCCPGEMRVKKEAALRSDKKVWKLTGVDCWCDPEWTLRLLKRCAPHLEQLQLQYPGREHLEVVRDCMPHLRRLEIRGWCGLDLQREPFHFDQGPADKRNTLDWLEVFLPTQTALSLLRAHRGSLRKLRLVVAEEWAAPTPSPSCEDVVPDAVEEVAGSECEWPEEDGFAVVPWGEDCVKDVRGGCWDELLQECVGHAADDVALKSVSLMWLSPRSHDSWHCRRFARTLRDARADIAVECEVCRRYGADRVE
ncbi:uncharacterized protein LOC117645132 [Thrips palmi]|uniref:Uncharacterized protein LOC117645132 n=1 Tax=Thrips palmi TaxID=161013 RepID=A0A6P8YU15_THRPL|nr:uncharacterized protein LOC117645132 [Thrips palmi]